MLLANIGVLQNIETFRVGGHESVFDAVVNHFHKVTSAVRPTVQVTFFRSATGFFAPRCAIYRAAAWRKRLENRIEPLDDFVFAANHLAIAAFQPPYAAAGADVDVVNPFLSKLLRAANIVNVG